MEAATILSCLFHKGSRKKKKKVLLLMAGPLRPNSPSPPRAWWPLELWNAGKKVPKIYPPPPLIASHNGPAIKRTFFAASLREDTHKKVFFFIGWTTKVYPPYTYAWCFFLVL